MKNICRIAIVLFTFSLPARSSNDSIQTLAKADDARVAAITGRDGTALNVIFSDELHYAHSTGAIDDKAGYMDLLLSGRTKYLIYDQLERKFTFPAPGIALMMGKARIRTVTGGTVNDGTLGYLAVWRKEAGVWRFLAWQSCKLPDAAVKAK